MIEWEARPKAGQAESVWSKALGWVREQESLPGEAVDAEEKSEWDEVDCQPVQIFKT